MIRGGQEFRCDPLQRHVIARCTAWMPAHRSATRQGADCRDKDPLDQPRHPSTTCLQSDLHAEGEYIKTDH